MPRQPRQLGESGLYHVMMRGINRQPIFLDDEDREQFLRCLRTSAQLSGCRVLAYCLMGNHVHLVLRADREPIGQVIKRLGVRYAGWHNRRHQRVGHLFQDRFKSVAVEDDEHLIVLLRYVWNNPVEAGIVDLPHAYRWSSLFPHRGSDGVVDPSDLLALMPASTLAELTSRPSTDPPLRPVAHERPNMTDADAVALATRVCTAHGARRLTDLPRPVRRHVVAQLVALGVGTRQLARVISMSRSAVHRVAASNRSVNE